MLRKENNSEHCDCGHGTDNRQGNSPQKAVATRPRAVRSTPPPRAQRLENERTESPKSFATRSLRQTRTLTDTMTVNPEPAAAEADENTQRGADRHGADTRPGPRGGRQPWHAPPPSSTASPTPRGRQTNRTRPDTCVRPGRPPNTPPPRPSATVAPSEAAERPFQCVPGDLGWEHARPARNAQTGLVGRHRRGIAYRVGLPSLGWRCLSLPSRWCSPVRIGCTDGYALPLSQRTGICLLLAW